MIALRSKTKNEANLSSQETDLNKSAVLKKKEISSFYRVSVYQEGMRVGA